MATSIFDFTDYKVFVRKLIESRPKRGHGQFAKLAAFLRISSVAISQIIRGSRDFSLEQALEAAQFLLLGPEETEYFLLLVERSRAGTRRLQEYLDRKIATARMERSELAKRVKNEKTLSDPAKAIFYSNWHYSAVRIASSIPELQNINSVADRLALEPSLVAEAVRFLLDNGLCRNTESGFTMGPSSTMLSTDSPFINNHRRNWRIRALNHLSQARPADLFYSGLVSLSKEDQKKFKQEFVDLISRFVDRVKDSPSETLACMNLDWFEL